MIFSNLGIRWLGLNYRRQQIDFEADRITIHGIVSKVSHPAAIDKQAVVVLGGADRKCRLGGTGDVDKWIILTWGPLPLILK